MARRWRGPRWGLLGVAAAIVAVVAALSIAASTDLETLIGADAPGLKDALEFVAIMSVVACILVIPALVLTAFFLPPRREVDPTWRRRLALFRTTRALASARPDPKKAARACANLSDDGLRVAAILPDHSEAGRSYALAALTSRGLDLDPLPEVRVPSFFGPQDLPTAQQAVRNTDLMRTICRVSAGLSVAVMIVLLAINKFSIDPAVERAAAQGYPQEVLADLNNLNFELAPPEVRSWPEMAGMEARNTAAKAAAVIAAVFASGLFFASWLRARPMRVLLLRKFNDRKLGKTYNRLLSNDLQTYGHVIALADKHVRRSTLGWLGSTLLRGMHSVPAFLWALATIPILFALRMTDRTRWGPAFVGAPRDFRLLARRLFDRLELNIETTFVSKGYLVRTSDPWWRLVVRLMMDAADVIVLDASQVTAGTAWEIEALTQFGLWERVVPIALDQQESHAQEALAQTPATRLHLYDAWGRFADANRFHENVFEALERSVTAREAAPIGN